MKLLLENWREYLNEENLKDLFNLKIDASKKVIATAEPWRAMTREINQEDKLSVKPKGVWYACGNEWLELVKKQVVKREINYLYEIELNYEKTLKIGNQEEFIAFEDKYGKKKDPNSDDIYINWGKVRLEYGGIEICPHQKELSYDHWWYYSWDIASGCIWRPSAIQKDGVSLLAQKELKGESEK